jgi:apolipoprotein N-acyltransferase
MPRAGAVGTRPGVLVAAAAAGGALYFLGYLGWGVWPCLLVFLVPFWWALDRTASARGAACLGAVFGAVAYAGGFPWLWALVGPFLEGNRALGAMLWLAYGAWFAAGFVAYALAFRRLRRSGWPLAMAGVAPLVLLEWLWPQLFPVNAGSALLALPLLVQAADLGGPLLLTALVGAVNAGVFVTAAWWRGDVAPPRAAWLAVAAVVLAAGGYGGWRTAQLARRSAAAPAITVGVVQANLGLLEKRTLSRITHRRHLEETRALLADGPVDLVVWPETAYVRGLRRPLPISGSLVREELRVPILFGGSTVEEEGGQRRTRNSALLVGADGMIRDAYDKNLLIPLAEYVPLSAWMPASWFPHVQDFGAAVATPALHLGAYRIATPICYEAVRADLVRRMVRDAEPHLLVTLANDAWFGDSAEPRLHLALARLRAIEHRRWLVRATNSGISALVDPTGRVVAQTPLLERAVLRGTVHPLSGDTLYGRLGDWPGWVALVLVAGGLLTRRRLHGSETAVAADPVRT